MEKRLSKVFIVLALILSHIGCAVVAYSYCDMQWGIRYMCYSAPASIVFYAYGIPFCFGIIICLVLSYVFAKKHNKKVNSAHSK